MRPWLHVSCMVTPQNRVLETLTHGPGAQLGDTAERNHPLERDVGSYPAVLSLVALPPTTTVITSLRPVVQEQVFVAQHVATVL